MASQGTNASRLMFLKGQIKLDPDSTDTYRFILIRSGAGFVFNPNTITTYTDVSDYEVLDGTGGYTKGGKEVEVISTTIDAIANRAYGLFTTVQWVASGSSIVTIGGILYRDVVGGDYSKVVLGWHPTEGTRTVEDGTAIVFSNITVDLKQPAT